MTLAFALLVAWAVLLVAPATPIGRVCGRWLVDAPVRVFNRITRGHIITWFALAAFVALVVWQLEGDGVALLRMMAPEIISWLTMFEIGTLVDLAVAAAATASAVRLRNFTAYFTARLPGAQRRAGRARRTRSAPSKPANDDEHIYVRFAA